MADECIRVRRLYDGLEALDLSVLDLDLKLLPWLRSGQLVARAGTAITRSGNDSGITTQDVEIGREVWDRANRDGFDLAEDRLTIYSPTHSLPRFEAAGLSFDRAGIARAFDLSDEEADQLGRGIKKAPARDGHEAKQASNAGARPNTEMWSKYLAAFAAVAEETAVAADEKESAIHDRVALYLQDRGHKAPHIDTVRPAIRRAKAWLNGHDFEGDDRQRPPE